MCHLHMTSRYRWPVDTTVSVPKCTRTEKQQNMCPSTAMLSRWRKQNTAAEQCIVATRHALTEQGRDDRACFSQRYPVTSGTMAGPGTQLIYVFGFPTCALIARRQKSEPGFVKKKALSRSLTRNAFISLATTVT